MGWGSSIGLQPAKSLPSPPPDILNLAPPPPPPPNIQNLPTPMIKGYTRHISYLYITSFYLKLLVSQSQLSGIRKDTLKYKLSEMNFDFEIPSVDCMSKENYYSYFKIKNTSQSLETPSHSPTFFSKKNFKYKIYTYVSGL